MINLLLLMLSIEFGVERACSDPDVEMLQEFVFKVEQISTGPMVFEYGSIKLNSPLPAGCSLLNTEGVIQFDVTDSGQIVNYTVVSMSPPRIHTRRFIKAISGGKVKPEAYGSNGNQLLIHYVQYENKT